MRAIFIPLLIIVVGGCAGESGRSEMSFEGTWQVSSERAPGDTVVGYTLRATHDTSGWTMRFPGREPLRVSVTLMGDSVVGEVEPYESVLRPGVQVQTRFTLRVKEGRLEGETIARYSTNGPDSVLILRNVGVRTP